jgi:uncharacterized protein (DUF362 family)
MKHITRRDFLKVVGAGTIGLMANPRISLARTGRQASTVIQCHDDYATSGSSVNDTVVQIMVDESIKTLTGIADVGEAWKSIFPGITDASIIGIKVNAVTEYVPTRPELVECIINGLTQMQFGGTSYIRNNVIIYDRSSYELSSAGYTIYTGSDPNTVRCFGSSQAGVGYDTNCPLIVDVYPSGTNTKYPSKILSQMIDYLINVAVLKNHGTAQVTLTLKNHYGSVNTPLSNEMHGFYCTPSIPSVNQQIRDHIDPNDIQKIFITDALWASVLYGPGGYPSWNPKKILMSFDPVACDYRGWELINDERTHSGYSAIAWPVYHIQTASQSPYSLGSTEVDLVEIENPSGVDELLSHKPASGRLQVMPNPFRTSAVIAFTLDRDTHVHIDIIDRTGRVCDRIYSGSLDAGTHRIQYHPQGRVPAGTYFLRLYDAGKMYLHKLTRID